MLYQVRTEIEQGAGNPELVDTWTLGYKWLVGDVNWDLAMASVQHAGQVGGTSSLPQVTFAWTGMNNRVDYGESYPRMYRYRLTSVSTETGARVDVAYNAGTCNSSKLTGDAVPGNTMPCFPQEWTGGDFGGNVWTSPNSDNSSGHWVAVSRKAYDSYGRVIQDENVGNRTTFYAYTSTWTPSGGNQDYATTNVVVQKPLTGSTFAVTTTDLNPEWGTPYDVIDPSSLRTDYGTDPLGRVTQVWLPGQTMSPRSGDLSPNYTYNYNVSAGAPSWVSTTALIGPRKTAVTSYQIFDSLLRPRQTQSPAEGTAGGTEVTDAFYDTQGRTLVTDSPYTIAAVPSGNLFLTAQTAVPSATRLAYDGAGRVTDSQLDSYGTLKWDTQRQYPYTDETTVIPPAGGTTTTTFTDGRGRVTQVDQYHVAGAPGPTTPFDGTAYTYSYLANGVDVGGTQMTATDAGGNTWTWTRDRAGQVTSSTYPDTGTTTQTWNDLGELTSATDGAGKVVSWSYDAAGRKTAEYNSPVGSQTGAVQLAAWGYDSAGLAGGGSAVGPLASATSYTGGTGGEAYVRTVGGYDKGYRPTSVTWTVPSKPVTGALAGSYTFGYSYNIDGNLNTVTYPPAGGLGAETVNYGYDSLGSPYSLWSAASDYVQQAVYTPVGLPAETDLGVTSTAAWSRMLASYDPATLRLAEARVQVQAAPSGAWGTVSDVAYGYDASGNITSAGESATGAVGYQCYTYDYLARLAAAWSQAAAGCPSSVPAGTGIGGAVPYEQTFSYDAGGAANGSTGGTTGGTTGLLTSGTLITGPPGSGQATASSSYAYPAYGAELAHAVQSAATTNAAGTVTSAVGYDGAGRLAGEAVTAAGTLVSGVVPASGTLCADDYHSGTAPGTKVDLYTCNGTAAQSWTAGPDGTVRVRGLCLDVSGGGSADGTPIDLQTCNTSSAAQLWQAGLGRTLVNPASGKCLDDPGATTVTGTQLDLSACIPGAAGQVWATAAGAAGAAVPPAGTTEAVSYTALGATSAVTFTQAGAVTQTAAYRYDDAGAQLVVNDGATVTLYLPGEELTAAGTTVTATRYYSFAGQVVAAARVCQISGVRAFPVSFLIRSQENLPRTPLSGPY